MVLLLLLAFVGLLFFGRNILLLIVMTVSTINVSSCHCLFVFYVARIVVIIDVLILFLLLLFGGGDAAKGVGEFFDVFVEDHFGVSVVDFLLFNTVYRFFCVL